MRLHNIGLWRAAFPSPGSMQQRKFPSEGIAVWPSQKIDSCGVSGVGGPEGWWHSRAMTRLTEQWSPPCEGGTHWKKARERMEGTGTWCAVVSVQLLSALAKGVIGSWTRQQDVHAVENPQTPLLPLFVKAFSPLFSVLIPEILSPFKLL